jgi:tripartite-type tricarboxylate transporter receptor subunit TctC
MKSGRFAGVGFLSLVVALSFAGAGQPAEKFPAKPITVVIGFQPGDTDNILRPFVEKLPEYLGQPISFVYKPGAGGAIGAKFVATSKPDGYTWVGTSQSSIAVVPLSQEDAGYTWESFAPISHVSESIYTLVIKADARWKTLKDFVDDAKQNPGKISYSSSGKFGLPHICGMMLEREAGISLNYIPSAGSNPAITAVLGGHVDAYTGPLTAAMGHIRAGTMRPLATFTKTRSKFVPDAPTCTELGYDVGIEVNSGFLAPKDTPKEIVDAIDKAVQKVIENHKEFIVERMDNIGQQLNYAGPEKYKAMLKSNNEMFSKILKDVAK